MTPRTYIGLRLSTQGVEKADELAKQHGLTRAEILRLAVTAGFKEISTLENLIERSKERL